MLCVRLTPFPFTTDGSFPRAWLEPPRKKTTSCGVSRLMGLTIVRPPKYICYSRWSQPTYVQRNLNRLVTSERLNTFILYRSGFLTNYCFMKLIHTGKYIKSPLYLMFNRKNSMYHVKYRYNLSYFWHTFLIQIV